MSESKSLRQMAAEAARSNTASCAPTCPKCGSRDFLTYGHIPGTVSVVMRYKVCRHCGHKVITATESRERIVRDVN